MRLEITEKAIELDKLKEAYNKASLKIEERLDASAVASKWNDENNLRDELTSAKLAIEERDLKIEQLTKELQIRTQNLQKLVNTELWSKNKEIAKLHNHMTASHSISALVKELLDVGIQVKITNDAVQLTYVNDGEAVDVKTVKNYVEKLVGERTELEKEIDYLKWLKLISKPDIGNELESSGSDTERARKYCELLRTHLKELVRFMKEMLRKANHSDTISKEHKKIFLDVFLDSKILPDDFVPCGDAPRNQSEDKRIDGVGKKSASENLLDLNKNHNLTHSDSEAFSEPDRTVSLARIGLQEARHKAVTTVNKSRFSKYTKTFSDSEDSVDYVPYHKTYQNDLNDLDVTSHIHELKETNNLIYSELNALRNELARKTLCDDVSRNFLKHCVTTFPVSQYFDPVSFIFCLYLYAVFRSCRDLKKSWLL